MNLSIRLCLLIMISLLWAIPAEAIDVPHMPASGDDAINLHCLRASYPGAFQIIKSGSDYELLFPDGSRVPYSSARQAMAEPYPLEPERPATPMGVAPGRQRAYDFLGALYGTHREQTAANLKAIPFMGKKLSLTPAAAEAFRHAAVELSRLPASFRKWLIPAGGFHWRKIAGEDNLSAHSYGIALDFSPNKAPYWRWSKINPHPLQQSYPSEIVSIMERHGFIWGGKWHEYDLMHYEYRPEIICKARLKSTGNKTQFLEHE